MFKNPEQFNKMFSIVCCLIGFLVMFFLGVFYILSRETWQIIGAFVGLIIIAFGRFADNQ